MPFFLTKICKRCGEEKPREAYYDHESSADGLLGICIECKKQVSKELHQRRMANPTAAARVRLQNRRASKRFYDRKFRPNRLPPSPNNNADTQL